MRRFGRICTVLVCPLMFAARQSDDLWAILALLTASLGALSGVVLGWRDIGGLGVDGPTTLKLHQ